MKRGIFNAIAVVSALLCVATIAHSDPIQSTKLQTTHFDLDVEQLSSSEASELLEQFYITLRDAFGCEPSERLKVTIFATPERWQEVLRANGIDIESYKSDIFYEPRGHEVYLMLADREAKSRYELLVAVSQQFRVLTREKGRELGPADFEDGLAQHFAVSYWNGKRLIAGVVPDVVEYGAGSHADEALEQFRKVHNRDLRSALGASREKSRFMNWAIVTYARSTDHKAFKKWCGLIERGQPPLPAWEEAYGPVTAQVSTAFEAWLQESHPRFAASQGAPWFSTGQSLRCAREDDWGVALLRGTATNLCAEVEVRGGQAGVTIQDPGAHDYFATIINGRQSVEVQRSANGGWEHVSNWPIPEPQQARPIRMSVKRQGEKAVLMANERELGSFDVTPKAIFGFGVCDGEATFNHVVVEGLK